MPKSLTALKPEKRTHGIKRSLLRFSKPRLNCWKLSANRSCYCVRLGLKVSGCVLGNLTPPTTKMKQRILLLQSQPPRAERHTGLRLPRIHQLLGTPSHSNPPSPKVHQKKPQSPKATERERLPLSFSSSPPAPRTTLNFVKLKTPEPCKPLQHLCKRTSLINAS